MRGVVSGGSIGRLPLGAGQLAKRLLLCAGADGRLTVGSALCDLLVDGAELGVAVRVLLAFQGPGRA
ncbi:hypothetical protein RPQ02_40105 [Streptomyces sp. AM2-3-1]|uniref:hypothetical protein n=1 Tax=Streptomyces sp. AM2-3-1 TaxID=3075824 RepID=UPI0028C51090|nr:hypothetical protein [Streptomyces sp. AM2-3-1]WNO62427.1 hypothetical protein RPQ02_00675 [Streptomyces sp. AM2-3-1]WNO69519.1 hypothetical protein RPQ02_40105 [Streptomyces sp. AM2-3-1]